MTRGEPYGKTILDDRGPHPKNAGDRLAEYGDALTLAAEDPVEAGEFVSADGDGGVVPFEEGVNENLVGVAKHSFDPDAGDEDPKRRDDRVTVRLGGVIRALGEPDGGVDPEGIDGVVVLDEYGNDDVLVRL